MTSQQFDHHDQTYSSLESSTTSTYSVSEADTAPTTIADDYHDVLGNIGALTIGGPSAEVEAHAHVMQQRCRNLLNELEEYQAYLRQLKKESSVELRTFKGGLQAEMKLLNRLAKADPSSPKTSHGLRSSNLSFFTTVWDTAKGCTSITSFGKKFNWIPGSKKANIDGNLSTNGTAHRTNGVVVDIVAQEGLEWIKVSSKTEKRIIWDLAKAGWVEESSDEESENESLCGDDDPEGLLGQVEALKKASLATRVRYQHPKIRLVLPRIKGPDSKEVRRVLQKIRDMGVTVQLADSIPAIAPEVPKVLDNMVADRFASFSESLNIDCTILLAFASDLSHSRVQTEEWHNKAIQRQIEMESHDQLLPSSLWPACAGKPLVCTKAAAVRMQEIVATIGTPTERRRTAVMLGVNIDESSTPLTQKESVEEFQRLSAYEVPLEWQLPIQIVDFNDADIDFLPNIAEKVAESLSAINRSVFLFGWATERTTISSNRAVAKEVEATIEENRVDEETKGPDIWLCPTSRSLVGKEKQRRGWSEAGCVHDGGEGGSGDS